MRFSKKKRGAIEVQFNWIFVLIVGALILVFFINISNAQRKNADQKLSFDLISKIDLIMSGALAIPKTGQIFDMPNIPFNLECNAISTSGVSKQFPDRIIFGPDVLKGKKLVVWSQDWNVPYKITNFLYMTTSGVRYIVVAAPSNQAAQDFYNSLPENITKEIAPLDSSLKDKNNYKIKLIFLDSVASLSYPINYTLPAFMQKMPDSAVSGIYIKGGSVRFIAKEGNSLNFVGDNISIYKDPMVFGAVFAENKEEFNCSYMKAFEKLHYVSEVYQKREELLADGYAESSQTECRAPETRDTTDYNIDAIAAAALRQDIDKITENEGIVVNINNNALRMSCAPIY
jgi:hypothetical protein